jgi:hypothetical protein
MASSQDTQPSKMNKREETLVLKEACRSFPELWDTEIRHYSIRVKKAAACDSRIAKLIVLEPDASRTRRHTDTDINTDKPDWKPVLCQGTFSSVFRIVVLHTLTSSVWGP